MTVKEIKRCLLGSVEEEPRGAKNWEILNKFICICLLGLTYPPLCSRLHPHRRIIAQSGKNN